MPPTNNDTTQFQSQGAEKKPAFHVISTDDWKEMFNAINELKNLITVTDEKVNQHDIILTHPTSGLIAKFSEMEKAMTEKFHKFDLDLQNRMNEIKMKEEQNYNAIRAEHVKQIYEIQDKFRENLQRMNAETIAEMKKIADTVTAKIENIDNRVKPLEEKKVASGATWHTAAIILMGLGELVLIGAAVAQAIRTH